MLYWEKFYRNIQQDFKLYLFILILFCAYRMSFIAVMNGYLSNESTYKDIVVALYYGLRISLKSAAILVMPSFGVCTCLSLLLHSEFYDKIRLWIGYVLIIILTILFLARIPYYEQFHMAFNQFLFNTFNDDINALIVTLIKQYMLLPRLALAVGISLGLAKLLKKWLSTKTLVLTHHNAQWQRWWVRMVMFGIIYFFVMFSRFGGSFTYAHDVNWENAGVTKDDLLNEAILDDVQALYRAYVMHERLAVSTGVAVDTAKIHEYGARLAGHRLDAASIEDYLKKTAQGAKIPRPKHVFLIIAESYANWPLLGEYNDLNIANGVKSIVAREDAIYVPAFLPGGMGTIAGVNSIITGFTEVNLYLNYQSESYKEPYATALAPQIKKLGYHTSFWYAGPDSWERIKDFTLAQGFDEFHAYGDFQSSSGNVWGADDKYLFKAVETVLPTETASFHVILTVSNHAPYTVDLTQEGFNAEQILGGLPAKYRNNGDIITQLGHFWYSDKILSDFVKNVYAEYPDSLFIITGDHADRLNIEASPGLYHRYAVPFVVMGKGITKYVFPAKSAGSHIDIIPTIIELIAPPGFEYYAVGNSLTRGNNAGFNYGFWITSDFIGKIGETNMEQLPGITAASIPDINDIQTKIDAARAVSWWRVKNGKTRL